MAYPILAILVAAGLALVVATLAGSGLARAGFPLPDERQRLGRLDGLRGYLALSVMIHHFVVWFQVTRLGGTWSPPTVNFFNSLGTGGVALFFMTTGFVFYPRILKGWRGVDWRATYISRLFRIYPLVLVALALISLVILARTGSRTAGPPTPATWADQPAAFAEWLGFWAEPPLFGEPDSGRINAYVLWSLWCEAMFYLFVLPGLAFLRDLTRGRVPSWCLPFALGLLAALLSHFLRHPFVLPYLPLFAIGMLAFELRSRPAVARLLSGPPAAFVAILALAAAMVLKASPFGFPQILAYGFFFACVGCDNSFGRLLATRGALVLGECSFGIYLLHGILLDVLFVDVFPRLGELTRVEILCGLPVAAAVIVAVGGLVYVTLERPCIRTGRRLAERGRARAGRDTPAEAAAREVAP